MTLKPIFFFDLDNCLYNKDLHILSLMRLKIQDYFVHEVGIPVDQVVPLQKRYQQQYGLSLRGLQKEYSVDPLDYDIKVDQSLPLDGLITKDEELIKMLQKLNCKKWVFTNAYRPHAVRCLKLLGVENEFDGLIYTNYLLPDFNCKPEPAAFLRAMKDAGAVDPKQCYFIDDSANNIDAAQKMGWTTIHLADDASKSNHGDYQIEDIYDLPQILPELFEPILPNLKFRRQSVGITTAA
ncbi:pyrimidine 5'-nucleotidase [Cokeromyces recurvatus]|uniref:pyrimidine 5'-nucleotidase n=1 Tax=Cokeromyces recurvatus TaxID=90255 RepID=UPI0022208933|nr:pyrimidine 5'-nucleotidase [Cokeromyces recurvatus]KAI7906329.1 pyrimidine 5'-nucleotidase [Cokeromyces recurvatus]